MKKVSALLLTAVLGSSMVFAGISGSVTTKYGYDLDNKTLGFNNANDVKAEFVLSTEDSKISEGDIHAEITAKLSLKVKDLTQDNDVVAVLKTADKDLSAKIVGSNWYVNILGADDVADYAKDFNVDGSDDKEAFHNYKFTSSDAQGVTVGYTYEEGKTVKVSVGSEMDLENDNYKNYVAVASPSFMLAEGLTAEAAVALQNNNKDVDFAGGLKVAYANEEAGYSVMAATDMGYENDAFDMEASMKANYSLATLNAYFATKVVENSDADAGDAEYYSYDASTTGNNLLSVKLDADLGKVIENVPVTMYAQVSGMDATDSTYLMNAGVDYTLAMENASLAIGLDGGVKFFETSDWMLGGDVKFTPANNAYVAKAAVKYLNDNASAGKALKPSVSVESTTLVNGATLTAEYADAVLSLEDGGTHTYGKINAICKIEF